MTTARQHPVSRRLLVVLAAVVIVAAGARVAYTGLLPNVFPKRFGVVEPGKVYRSGQLTPGALESVVKHYGIKTVIDLGSTIHGQHVGEERNQRAAAALGVTRYVMRLFGDSTGNPNYYVQALRLAADPANQPVLVHCGAGTERTGLFCILYKHMHTGMSLEAGFKEAESYGHRAKRTPQMRATMERYGEEIIRRVREGGQMEGREAPALPEPVPATSP